MIESMIAPAPPILPIPTAFGFALMESVVQGSILEQMAKIAAIGASLDGQDEEKAWDNFRHRLRDSRDQRQPDPDFADAFNKAAYGGIRHLLQQDTRDESDSGEVFYQRLTHVTGPFAAMVAGFIPASPNAAQQNLLDFSDSLDQLGAAFFAATEEGDLRRAKDLFLGVNWLDNAYWSFAMEGMEDPSHIRETLRAAGNWQELRRACGPIAANTALSWLSLLDLAVLTGGRHDHGYFPLFLPLATRLAPAAVAAQREGRPLPNRKWSERFDLPVPNLIRTLRHIADDINTKINKRAKPPEPRRLTKADREKLTETFKDLGRHDMLSRVQFDRLVLALQPDAELQNEEGCGFDVYALHLAANFFSLLTPRDGRAPSNRTRRKRPSTIVHYPEIPDIYERWWRRNLRDLAGDAVEHPRPEWFTKSLGIEPDGRRQ